MVSEREKMSLQLYIDAWRDSIDAIVALDIDEDQGRIDTCLPEWGVRDVLAHLVHLEEALASGTRDVPAGSGPGVSSEFTQAGVDALASVHVDELLVRLEAAVARRHAQLTPAPSDPATPADRSLAGKNWNWGTLLRNRAIDAWLHEQDIRRALGLPGNLGTAGALVTVHGLAASLPFVIGKLADAPRGHAVRFELSGEVPLTRTIVVGEDGRASETDAAPSTIISMSAEAFTRLAGGREPLETFDVTVEGDAAIAARILANLAVTP